MGPPSSSSSSSSSSSTTAAQLKTAQSDKLQDQVNSAASAAIEEKRKMDAAARAKAFAEAKAAQLLNDGLGGGNGFGGGGGNGFGGGGGDGSGGGGGGAGGGILAEGAALPKADVFNAAANPQPTSDELETFAFAHASRWEELQARKRKDAEARARAFAEAKAASQGSNATLKAVEQDASNMFANAWDELQTTTDQRKAEPDALEASQMGSDWQLGSVSTPPLSSTDPKVDAVTAKALAAAKARHDLQISRQKEAEARAKAFAEARRGLDNAYNIVAPPSSETSTPPRLESPFETSSPIIESPRTPEEETTTLEQDAYNALAEAERLAEERLSAEEAAFREKAEAEAKAVVEAQQLAEAAERAVLDAKETAEAEEKAAMALRGIVESQEEHAGGMLTILKLDNSIASKLSTWNAEVRRVRVWTPPGFHIENPPTEDGWPCVVLNDGQNLFEVTSDDDDHDTWRAGHATAELISSGKIPPCVVVGIDHAGVDERTMDYLTFPPGSGDGDFRRDAENWPGGGAKKYCDWVVDDLMPMVRAKYGVSFSSRHLAFGGSSFGAMSAITMSMRHPHAFASTIVLSPAIWAGGGRYLKEISGYRGGLPNRIFVGFGTREFTGTRDSDRISVDRLLVAYNEEYVRSLREQGLGPSRLVYVLEDAGHEEIEWAKQYSRALAFTLPPSILTPVTRPIASVVAVTESSSPTVSGVGGGGGGGGGVRPSTTDDVEMDRLGREMKDELFFTLPAPDVLSGHPATLYFNTRKSDNLRGLRELTLHGGYDGWKRDTFSIDMSPCDIPSYNSAEWFSASFQIPAGTKQLNFVIGGEGDKWDNNDGDDYLVTISDPELKRPIPENVVNAFDEEANSIWADRHGADLFFVLPSPLKPGEPAAIYVNPQRSENLANKEPVVIVGGFDGWSNGNFELTTSRAPIPQFADVRWQTAKVNVPKDARDDLQMVFADERKEIYDNNDEQNYTVRL